MYLNLVLTTVWKENKALICIPLKWLCAKQGWPLITDKKYAENQITFSRNKNK